MTQTNVQAEYWLALVRAPGVGPVSFLRLLEHFESPKEVFEAGRSRWRELNLKAELIAYLLNPDWYAVEQDMQWLAKPGNLMLTLSHPDYPPRLREIHDPPPVLFVHGDYTLLSSLQLAMVGTRSPSERGKKVAWEFAEYLSSRGFTITSGMAFGIDAACHDGALKGSGKTIAVAGTGLDRVYPAQHRDLAYKISEKGALVSEFLPGTIAKPANFPRRNRVISGLCVGTLVVEAPLHSGALYTAYQALEQGREVFAIPDSIHNPLVKGCHKLLKEGAKLVETAADIVEELLIHLPTLTLPPVSEQTPPPARPKLEPPARQLPESSPALLPGTKPVELEPEYADLLMHLGKEPTSIDNLVDLSGLTVEIVSSRLLLLELRGLVTTHPGGLYTRLG